MEPRSLSKTEAKVILALEAGRQDVVSLPEIQRRASVSPGFARKLAHDLVRRGWLQRLRRGTYLVNPSHRGPDALPDTDPFRLGSRLVRPYYFGYATAAELHGLLPQASRVYYLVTTVRYQIGSEFASRFRVVHTRPARFFGLRRVQRRGESIIVSDVERTLVDCLDRPEFSGGIAGVAQMLAQAKPRLNWARFGAYLRRFGNRSLARRAGYLAERVRPGLLPPSGWVKDRLPRPGDPFVPLDRPSLYGRTGPRDPRWRIVRNLSDAQLFAEGEVQ